VCWPNVGRYHPGGAAAEDDREELKVLINQFGKEKIVGSVLNYYEHSTSAPKATGITVSMAITPMDEADAGEAVGHPMLIRDSFAEAGCSAQRYPVVERNPLRPFSKGVGGFESDKNS